MLTIQDVLQIEVDAVFAAYPRASALYLDAFWGVTDNRDEAQLVPLYGPNGNISGFSRARIERNGVVVEEEELIA